MPARARSPGRSAARSPRRSARRSPKLQGKPAWYFLKPATRSWPVGDPRRGARDEAHARRAVVYMSRGFGARSEYPRLVRALAERYPPSVPANRALWRAYSEQRDAIARRAGRAVPSVNQLRGARK